MRLKNMYRISERKYSFLMFLLFEQLLNIEIRTDCLAFIAKWLFIGDPHLFLLGQINLDSLQIRRNCYRLQNAFHPKLLALYRNLWSSLKVTKSVYCAEIQVKFNVSSCI